MPTKTCDVAIIGGGIIGLATAHRLVSDYRLSVAVLEAESEPATHQSGHNSGVIHSGLYYAPGSLKARRCVTGRVALVRFCEQEEIPHEICGKLVLATREEQLARLDELERRGRANGLEGLERVGPERIAELEPHARGVAALRVPQTGIVDFRDVCRRLAQRAVERGAQIRNNARVLRVERQASTFRIATSSGECAATYLIGCAGLQADRVARLCGLRPGLRIVPFRGEYHRLRAASRHLCRNVIYPVPDPRLPFLGVHFTRTIHGEIEIGPNAVLALSREGYRRGRFSAVDTLATLGYPGFWRLAARFGATGLGELRRSRSARAFTRELQRMIPDIRPADFEPHGAGVRAQAVGPDGSLIDDFRIVEGPAMMHVLNAPSPAATASLSIARDLGRRAAEKFGLQSSGGAGGTSGVV